MSSQLRKLAAMAGILDLGYTAIFGVELGLAGISSCIPIFGGLVNTVLLCIFTARAKNILIYVNSKSKNNTNMKRMEWIIFLYFISSSIISFVPIVGTIYFAAYKPNIKTWKLINETHKSLRIEIKNGIHLEIEPEKQESEFETISLFENSGIDNPKTRENSFERAHLYWNKNSNYNSSWERYSPCENEPLSPINIRIIESGYDSCGNCEPEVDNQSFCCSPTSLNNVSKNIRNVIGPENIKKLEDLLCYEPKAYSKYLKNKNSAINQNFIAFGFT
ncbi:hypothetical protein BB558_000352 [Smittium angustum]|uniref:Uncharacterized protein n=1 Tax=Smittium angustum TaxID=133377 RepID=A0A2U1JEW4_SMIAN|nr:hypothetical protein BB558_000352 [Smittium angustum]